jgi:hypothetical protein
MVIQKTEDVMYGTCSTHGKYGKCINVSLENLKGRDLLADIEVDWKI